jgi:hypothetical protein
MPKSREKKRSLKHVLALPDLPDGESIDGRWAGTLTYFPSPAVLEVDFGLNEGKCEGAERITIPGRKQSYTAPLAGCSVDSNQVVFSVGDASDSISH